MCVEPSLPQLHAHRASPSHGARRPSPVDRAPTPRPHPAQGRRCAPPRGTPPPARPPRTPALRAEASPLAPRRRAAHLGPCGHPGAAGGLGPRQVARRGRAQPRPRQPRRGRRLGRRGGAATASTLTRVTPFYSPPKPRSDPPPGGRQPLLHSAAAISPLYLPGGGQPLLHSAAPRRQGRRRPRLDRRGATSTRSPLDLP